MTVNNISPLPSVLQPKEDDITDLLVADAHIGTRNSDSKMKPYIWKRRSDGIYILNVGKTWEKLVIAARIIAGVENPQDVIAISARPYGQRAVLKFAAYTGCASIAGGCCSFFRMARESLGTSVKHVGWGWEECMHTYIREIII